VSSCSHDLHDLGGYALDGLEPSEVEDVEARLVTCPGCRAELEELRGAAALLAVGRLASPPVPARVRERVIADAALRRARRRWAVVAAGVAAAAAAVGVVLGWQLGPATPPEVAVPVTATDPYTATGWVTYTAEDGRPALRLEVVGLDPLSAPAVYEVWLSTRDGEVLSVGRIDQVTDPLDLVVEVDGPWSRYRSMWVTAEPDRLDPGHDGPTVLSAPVPRTG
jgi:anti-sigma factor RsiW